MRLAAWLKQNHVSRTEFARRTGLRGVNGRAQAREHDRLCGESIDREQHDGRIGGGSLVCDRDQWRRRDYLAMRNIGA